MSLRVLFDECCSRKLIAELRAFLGPQEPSVVLEHLLDCHDPGTPDAVWLARLQKEQGWIVVTKDSGGRGAGDKLPVVCSELGITHVAFTPRLIQAGMRMKLEALKHVWPDLWRLHTLTPGTQVKLGLETAANRPVSFALRVGGRRLSFQSE